KRHVPKTRIGVQPWLARLSGLAYLGGGFGSLGREPSSVELAVLPRHAPHLSSLFTPLLLFLSLPQPNPSPLLRRSALLLPRCRVGGVLGVKVSEEVPSRLA